MKRDIVRRYSQNPILTKSGEERLIEWRNTLLRDDTGHVVGTFSSGSDITERKRAEEEVRHRAQLSELGAAVGLALTNTESLTHALEQCAGALVTHLGAALPESGPSTNAGKYSSCRRVPVSIRI